MGMQYRRTPSFRDLTTCALFAGLLACDGASDLGVAGNNQNLTPDCVAGDEQPLALTSHTLNLWPPNHKLHTIDVADCVTLSPTCDPDVEAEFVWASSDEPVDDIGDGHHEPDILITDCHQVQLRAERQGPKEGRVYKLGVRVADRSGNVAESVCTIVVDHDKRGVAGADSGEKYRITLDGADDRPLCDGTPPALPESDAGTSTPPVDGGGGLGGSVDVGTIDAGTPDVDAGVLPEQPEPPIQVI